MGIATTKRQITQSVMLQYLIVIKVIIIQFECVIMSGAKSGYLTNDKLACFDATGMNTYLVLN